MAIKVKLIVSLNIRKHKLKQYSKELLIVELNNLNFINFSQVYDETKKNYFYYELKVDTSSIKETTFSTISRKQNSISHVLIFLD